MARVKITPHNFKEKFLLSSNTKMKLTNITIYQHRVNVINNDRTALFTVEMSSYYKNWITAYESYGFDCSVLDFIDDIANSVLSYLLPQNRDLVINNFLAGKYILS
ncbi:TPA: hypothetical protein ACX6QF_003632 [Photobacterium damselae]